MNLLQTMRHHMKESDQESEAFLDQVDMLPAKEKDTFIRAIEWMTKQNFELMVKDSSTYRQKDWHPGIEETTNVQSMQSKRD